MKLFLGIMMVSGDGWRPKFSPTCLTDEGKPGGNPQPGKLTRPGNEPGPAVTDNDVTPRPQRWSGQIWIQKIVLVHIGIKCARVDNIIWSARGNTCHSLLFDYQLVTECHTNNLTMLLDSLSTYEFLSASQL